VLRPRLSGTETAAALVRAFGDAGRPYDFRVDVRSDAALVCTSSSTRPTSRRPGFAGIDFVIGMDKAIRDGAAIAFSVGLYQAMGAGKERPWRKPIDWGAHRWPSRVSRRMRA
jgi:hypothetical protein